jgi:hypothetical protein
MELTGHTDSIGFAIRPLLLLHLYHLVDMDRITKCACTYGLTVSIYLKNLSKHYVPPSKSYLVTSFF